MQTYKVVEYDDGPTFWYNEASQRHRKNGPALECPNGYKEYWQNGKLHREDGPAIEFTNGSKSYYINNRRHRDAGPNGALPAIEHANGSKEYWLNDQRHREDGPAIERYNGDKEYWLNGKMYSYMEWFKRTNKTKELSVKQISELLGYDVKIVKG